MDKYPINRFKVEKLKKSIDQTGFWDNILARPKPGHTFFVSEDIYVDGEFGGNWDERECVLVGPECEDSDPTNDELIYLYDRNQMRHVAYYPPIVELAYGHHRLIALQELGIEAVDIPVKELDDAIMLQVMVNENTTDPYQILFQKLQEMDAKITKISASLSKDELASRLGVSRQTVVGRSKRYRLSEEEEAALDT